jgi:predicted metalloendopeptidase
MHWRVVGSTRNVDGWYDAFGVKPGDKYYLPPTSACISGKRPEDEEVHHSQAGYVFNAASLLQCGERTAVVATT